MSSLMRSSLVIDFQTTGYNAKTNGCGIPESISKNQDNPIIYFL